MSVEHGERFNQDGFGDPSHLSANCNAIGDGL